MTKEQLTEAIEFLKYFHVKIDDKYVHINSGDHSVIMNPNTKWKKFLGHSISSIADAVANETNRKLKYHE